MITLVLDFILESQISEVVQSLTQKEIVYFYRRQKGHMICLHPMRFHALKIDVEGWKIKYCFVKSLTSLFIPACSLSKIEVGSWEWPD